MTGESEPVSDTDGNGKDEGGPVPSILRRALPIPRSRRSKVIALIIIIVLIGAVAAVAAPRGGDGEGGRDLVDITTLEPFNTTTSETVYIEEGTEAEIAGLYIGFYLLELPEKEGELTINFIDHIEILLRWQDEADEERFMFTWENQPDTVHISISDRDGLLSLEEEDTNARGEEVERRFEWDGDGEYIAYSLLRTGQYEYEGIDGWEVIAVSNDTVHWDNFVDCVVRMVQSGDQTHDRLPLEFVDSGNGVTFEISISGYYFEM